MAGKVAVENMDQRSDDAPCRHKVAFVSLEPGEGMGRGLHTGAWEGRVWAERRFKEEMLPRGK